MCQIQPSEPCQNFSDPDPYQHLKLVMTVISYLHLTKIFLLLLLYHPQPAQPNHCCKGENQSSPTIRIVSAPLTQNTVCIAQCAVCKVRCHCIFYGPGIRYSDIFGAPGIRYSVIIKLPCALLQTGHLETVHAPVVDTVTYFGGNHGSRV